jgi:hypothetical protein
MPLTDIQIKSLQSRDKRYLVSDGRGLSLDVLPSGFKSWIFRYTLNSKAEKITLAPYPDMTLKAARDRRDKLAAEVVAGQSPAGDKRARAEKAVEASDGAPVRGSLLPRGGGAQSQRGRQRSFATSVKRMRSKSASQVPRIELLD